MASSPSPPPSSPAAANGGDAVTLADPAGDAASPSRSADLLALPAPPPSSSSRRPPPPCWTHDETLALIDSYRDKWYALRRGNLRASHWQEVADAVARRTLDLPASTPKTSVQCRHKVEKLRKRYRAERQRSLARDAAAPPSSSWVYFRKMDSMEHGSGGAPAPTPRPGSSLARPPSSSSDNADPSSDEDDEDEDDPRSRGAGAAGSNTRSLHRLMANGGGNKSGGGGIAGGELRFTIPKAVRSKIVGPRIDDRVPSSNPTPSSRFLKGYGGMRSAAEEMRRKLEQKRRRERESESDAMGEMVSALQMLGDRFMRMEHKKMEMAREMEKVRMEMELKRTEMILESQRLIVDTFMKGLVGSKKRAKVTPEA